MGRESLEACARFGSVLRELEKWRLGGRRGRRIPERLWSDAVTLAQAHGVSKTSRALRLDYYGLQRRLEAVQADASDQSCHEGPTFVELTLPGRGAADCVLVVDGDHDRRLRIELRGAATSLLEPLAVALAGIWR